MLFDNNMIFNNLWADVLGAIGYSAKGTVFFGITTA